VVQKLSYEVSTIHEQAGFFHGLRLATARFATLLLAWCDEGGTKTEEGICLTVPLTESEIGQMIGTSRETVARLLGKLKDRSIVQRRAQVFLIRDKTALEGLAGKKLINHPESCQQPVSG
jgi:CRP/FNR family transcriptional regulator